MAVRQLKNRRWACYYRIPGPDGKKNKIKWEHFGRGPEGEGRANKRNGELELKVRRPAMSEAGPSFGELAKSYADNKDFSENSRELPWIRLQANILPFLGNRPAIGIGYHGLDRYVNNRPKTVKVSTIAREITDMKALSEVVGSRPETLMRHYQHVTKKIHRQTVAKIPTLAIRKYSQKTKKPGKLNRLKSLILLW